ncbi:MAG: VCBS repeat-containing protein [Myxococcales bacterium]|nr:VCBS repeat-containing protein [Myxococcales bacterium]
MPMRALLGCILGGCGASVPDGALRQEVGLPLDVGPEQTCVAPAASIHFTDHGEALGLQASATPDGGHEEGGFLALDDVTGDGWLDLLVGFQGTNSFYLGGEGGLSAPIEAPGGAAMGLFDMDGDQVRDVLLAGPPTTGLPFLVYTNGTFVMGEAPADGLPAAGAFRKDVTFGDFNADGALDVFIVGSQTPDGAGPNGAVLWGSTSGLVAGPRTPGALDGRRGFDAVPIDIDGDGQDEIYIANDMGTLFGGNVLLGFEAERLIDRTATCGCGVATSAMAVTAGDSDGDGLTDLYVAGDQKALLLAQGDGTFVDVAQASEAHGGTGLDMSGNTPFFDADNDGWDDFALPMGDWWGPNFPGDMPRFESPIHLLRRGTDGLYVDIAGDIGFPTEGSWRSVLARDVNDDGVLDWLASDVRRRPQWLMSDGCTANGWVAIDAPEGSRVEVSAGGRTWTRRATADQGYGAAAAPRVHVGVGEVGVIDLVRVVTVDGAVYEARSLAPRRRLAVPGTLTLALGGMD